MKLAGFIGCGNMGGSLAAAASTRTGEWEVMAADHHPEKLERLKDYGVIPSTAQEIAEKCRLIFLGVKPQSMEKTAAEIRGTLSQRRTPFTVVSMAAGLSTSSVASMLNYCPVIRIMPNMPTAVGQGVILYSLGGGVEPGEENAILNLLAAAGSIVRIDETKMDAATAITGCGPAFVSLFMAGMIEGAVRYGLPRLQAERFVLQTVLGTAKLALETEQNPVSILEGVCSPEGSTIEGVAELEKHGVRFAAMEAVRASYRRSVELGAR